MEGNHMRTIKLKEIESGYNNNSKEKEQIEISNELKSYIKKLVKESINEVMWVKNDDSENVVVREPMKEYDLSNAIIKEDPKRKHDVNFQMINKNKRSNKDKTDYNMQYISEDSVNDNVYYCDDDSLNESAFLPKPLRDNYNKLQNEQFIAYIQQMQKEQDIQNQLSDNYKLQNISDCGVVGNRIKEILSATGRTATWLSKVTEIPKSTISSIIYGTNSVSLENAFKISLAFKMSIEIIFIFDLMQDTEK